MGQPEEEKGWRERCVALSVGQRNEVRICEEGNGRSKQLCDVDWCESCSQVFRGCFLEGLVAAISCKLVVHTWLLAVVSSSSALS